MTQREHNHHCAHWLRALWECLFEGRPVTITCGDLSKQLELPL